MESQEVNYLYGLHKTNLAIPMLAKQKVAFIIFNHSTKNTLKSYLMVCIEGYEIYNMQLLS